MSTETQGPDAATMEAAQVEAVVMYRTEDGRTFTTRGGAEVHAEHLVNVRRANEMLDNGASVADACRAAGATVRVGSPLERITARTPLKIPHYQCSERPGYKVRWISSDLSLRVYGDAGSWNGPFGCDESIGTVERYAATTLTLTPTGPRAPGE